MLTEVLSTGSRAVWSEEGEHRLCGDRGKQFQSASPAAAGAGGVWPRAQQDSECQGVCLQGLRPQLCHAQPHFQVKPAKTLRSTCQVSDFYLAIEEWNIGKMKETNTLRLGSKPLRGPVLKGINRSFHLLKLFHIFPYTQF